jgi:DNA-binding NarL/FixJ family response regulator
MAKTRVVLADDHSIVIDGLRGILRDDCDVVATFADGRALVEGYLQYRPDVTIVDISMPNLNGIDATRRLRQLDPKARVIVLTMHADITYATEAFDAGASGYVVKSSAAQELLAAIRAVASGQVYVSPAIAKDLVQLALHPAESGRSNRPELTARQREVLQLVAEGNSIKEIARKLRISPKTVEYHKYRLMEQLDLATTAELTQYAIRHGLINQ